MDCNKYPLIIPIGCKRGCRGDDYSCIIDICKVVSEGNIVFMLYSEHVLHRLRQMDYKIEIKQNNGIDIGMYISRKGAKSVYDRF